MQKKEKTELYKKLKKRYDPTQKFGIQIVGRKTAQNNLYDPVKTPLISSRY